MWGEVRHTPSKADDVITLLMLAVLTIPEQDGRVEVSRSIPPEQVLAWELEGASQEEIREEVNRRGLTEYPEDSLINALAAVGTDAETLHVMRHCKAPRKVWKLGLRLPSPTDYLYEIASELQMNDLESALQTAQNELEKQPRNADLHLIRAHLLTFAEDWIAAYGEATQAVALDPQSPYAHGLRSTICYRSQLSECATREAELLVKIRPQDAASYIVLGHAQELQGNYAKALEAFAQAEKLHASYSAIYAGMGAVYQRTGAFEKAVHAYERAIRMDGNVAEYYCKLGQVYQTEGYARKAIEELKRAKELAPERGEILLALGNAYLAAEHYSEAAKEYEEVLRIAPQMELARSQWAKALRAQGKNLEADQLFAGALDPSGIAKPK